VYGETYSDEQLRAIGEFLNASKGAEGGE
jgi:hypothetical protein